MRPSWKLAVIGGEVTVLAAFTGLGIHLAMQPHRLAFRPPPLVLPTGKPAAIPALAAPLVPPTASSASAPVKTPFLPDLLRRFGQQDRNLVTQQWDVLQRLGGALEHYVESRVLEQLQKKR